VAATVACFLCSFAGSATAGIAEFLGGRAFFPVAHAIFMVLVGFTAGAGVQGGGFVLVTGFSGIMGCGLCIFWHVFTNSTVFVP